MQVSGDNAKCNSVGWRTFTWLAKLFIHSLQEFVAVFFNGVNQLNESESDTGRVQDLGRCISSDINTVCPAFGLWNFITLEYSHQSFIHSPINFISVHFLWSWFLSGILFPGNKTEKVVSHLGHALTTKNFVSQEDFTLLRPSSKSFSAILYFSFFRFSIMYYYLTVWGKINHVHINITLYSLAFGLAFYVKQVRHLFSGRIIGLSSCLHSWVLIYALMDKSII